MERIANVTPATSVTYVRHLPSMPSDTEPIMSMVYMSRVFNLPVNSFT